ncbi:hypothetical protein AVEN_57057-1 [Araneus ventricosus]|uniref:Uncharacterized protein n=1 Tax=Araneus ventricosus TaxID=182803 RepID=A0A4Y2XCB6_ARAVE|nr:hypothetical protein AVEN_57057-1 [Araneus ventricosus]
MRTNLSWHPICKFLHYTNVKLFDSQQQIRRASEPHTKRILAEDEPRIHDPLIPESRPYHQTVVHVICRIKKAWNAGEAWKSGEFVPTQLLFWNLFTSLPCC